MRVSPRNCLLSRWQLCRNGSVIKDAPFFRLRCRDGVENWATLCLAMMSVDTEVERSTWLSQLNLSLTRKLFGLGEKNCVVVASSKRKDLVQVKLKICLTISRQEFR